MSDQPEERGGQARVETPPIIGKLYDLLMWLMDRTQRFPRTYRGTLGRWVEEHTWGVLDLVIEAAYTLRKPRRLARVRLTARISDEDRLRNWHVYTGSSQRGWRSANLLRAARDVLRRGIT